MANHITHNVLTGKAVVLDTPIQPKTAEEIAQEEKVARIRARAEAVRYEVEASGLRTITPEQAADWIDATVVDLASAKVALKKMARAIIAIRDAANPALPE